ncbi:MAG: hypothetical protein H7X84_12990 [Verrucomicrobia bacterium]|nr:hypothetical protein [Prolixibacteraceae bacterium]
MAQEHDTLGNSVSHHSIKEHAHQTRLGKLIHRIIFSSNASEVASDQDYRERNPEPYPVVQGKIIRRIHITTLDPFGYSMHDTTIRPSRSLNKLGNTLHINTRQKVISNLLLIHQNESFDSLLFKESERLIRSQRYVHDVLAYTTLLPNTDSLDVHFRIMDIWSIVPKLRLSGSNIEIGLADNNFMGLGNRLHFDSRINDLINSPVIQLGYMIPNIGNSHITGSVQYYFSGDNDLVNNREFKRPLYSPVNSNLHTLTLSNRYLVKSIELSRSFFSPVTRWAGGLYIGQLISSQNYIDDDSISSLSNKTTISDLWGAWSWPLYKGNSVIARTTSLVVSARMLRVRYPERTSTAERLNIFNNQDFYFAGIGVTSRRYIQDRYIFNYGKVEHIPIGRAFGLTTGLNVQKTNQFYWGLKAAWGYNYRFGYLSSHLEYGTYIGSKGFRQQVITGRINYYTPLFSIGYWRLRQFIKPTVIIGINRLPADNLTLSEGMEGFEELNNPATRMMVLSLQTQSYAPWEIYGFRFGPYLFSSLGMLGHKSPQVSNKRIYAALGLGVLIKNNYLLVNTFQVSLTYYPFLPERGYHILNLNAYRTSDFGFHDFEISRPQVVDYR